MASRLYNRKAAAIIISAVMFMSTMSVGAIPAYADKITDLKSEKSEIAQQLADAQEKLEKAETDYDSVMSEKNSAESQINAAKTEIEQAQTQIAQVQEKLSDRMVDMYVNNETSLFLTMLLGSSSLSDLIQNWNAVCTINESYTAAIEQARTLRAEVAAKEEIIAQEELIVQEKASEAQQIKDNADATVDDYKNKVNSIDQSIRAEVLAQAAASASSNVSSDTSTSSTSIPANGSVVDYAYSRLGCPYVWGGSGPNSFDCSGLVMWCYAQAGVSLPHGSSSLYSCASARIPVSEAQPGDVLYKPGHVAICISAGGGTYIHAPTTGDVVKVASGQKFTCALRF